MTKEEIRQKYLGIRNSLYITDIRKRSKEIIFRLKNLKEFKKANIVLIYVSMGKEVDTVPFIEELLERKEKKVLVPFMNKNEKIDIAEIKRLTDLSMGKYGFLEPSPSLRVKKYKKLDIIIIPGIVFDFEGNRIGRGGGHFDFLLKNLILKKYPTENNLLKIGLAFSCQVIKKLDKIEAHDEKIDMIITEKEIIFSPTL